MANTIKVYSLKKTVMFFLAIFTMLVLSSCKKSFLAREFTGDSFVLQNMSGNSVTLHKGDVVIEISYRASTGAIIEYQGIRGRVYEWTYYLENFKPAGSVDKTGKKTARPIILSSNMPFGNALILLIGLSIFTFIALIVGRLISLIPFIGKFLFILIVLAILAIWTIIVIDLFRTGGIVEVVVAGIFIIVGIFTQGPKIIGGIIWVKE